jgi:hypothetical protein
LACVSLLLRDIFSPSGKNGQPTAPHTRLREACPPDARLPSSFFEPAAQLPDDRPMPRCWNCNHLQYIGFPKGRALWPPEAFPTPPLRSGLFSAPPRAFVRFWPLLFRFGRCRFGPAVHSPPGRGICKRCDVAGEAPGLLPVANGLCPLESFTPCPLWRGP